MRRTLSVPVLALACGLVIPACAYSRADGDKLRREHDALAIQVTSMQQTLSELQDKQGAELDRLRRDLDGLSKIAGKGTADLGVQIDESLQQVARLKGLVESFQERLSTVEAGVSKAQDSADTYYQHMQEKQALDQQKNASERQKLVEESARHDRLLADPNALFEESQKEITAGSPADARKLLRDFQVKTKNDRNLEKRQAEAQYLVGETFYAESNWQQAAAEYNTVRKTYPKSPKVPDALFRIGQCLEKLNLKDDAKVFYQQIVQKYAHTSVFKDAKARLQALR